MGSSMNRLFCTETARQIEQLIVAATGTCPCGGNGHCPVWGDGRQRERATVAYLPLETVVHGDKPA